MLMRTIFTVFGHEQLGENDWLELFFVVRSAICDLPWKPFSD